MPILNQVLKNYENTLLNYKYEIKFIDENKIEQSISFEFKKDNLKHLLGLHKISQYNLKDKNNKPRYPASLIYKKIKEKQITYKDIQSTTKSDEVSIRAIHFLELSYILDDRLTNTIYLFKKNKYNGKTQIKSEYILYMDKGSFSLNFGIAKDPIKRYYYPETWFINERNKEKFIKNQTKLKIKAIIKTKIKKRDS